MAEFRCEVCDADFPFKSHYERHLDSESHRTYAELIANYESTHEPIEASVNDGDTCYDEITPNQLTSEHVDEALLFTISVSVVIRVFLNLRYYYKRINLYLNCSLNPNIKPKPNLKH